MDAPFFEKLKTTKFRLGMLLCTAAYIATLLTLQYKRQSYPEPIQLLPQSDEQIQRLASTIQVGLYINKFPEFSFTKQLFVMDAIAWFKFPQATEALETVERFTLQNSLMLEDGSLIQKSPPIIKLVGDDVLVSYHIFVRFKTDQLFHQFPITGHRLIFVLENKSVTTNEVNFVSKPENFVLSPSISVETWVPQKTFAQGGYIRSVLNPKDQAMNIEYPGTVFSIDFKGIGARDLFSLYFPLFVVFFIGLLGLIVDVFNFTGLGIIAGSVPMLVLFRLVIQSESPDVAYMTHIDFTFYSLVLLSLLILFIEAYITLEAQRSKDLTDEAQENIVKLKLEKISNTAFFIMPILLTILMTIGYFR